MASSDEGGMYVAILEVLCRFLGCFDVSMFRCFVRARSGSWGLAVGGWWLADARWDGKGETADPLGSPIGGRVHVCKSRN
jgi:hypothetical protein